MAIILYQFRPATFEQGRGSNRVLGVNLLGFFHCPRINLCLLRPVGGKFYWDPGLEPQLVDHNLEQKVTRANCRNWRRFFAPLIFNFEKSFRSIAPGEKIEDCRIKGFSLISLSVKFSTVQLSEQGVVYFISRNLLIIKENWGKAGKV
jgi:hypothetical protein